MTACLSQLWPVVTQMTTRQLLNRGNARRRSKTNKASLCHRRLRVLPRADKFCDLVGAGFFETNMNTKKRAAKAVRSKPVSDMAMLVLRDLYDQISAKEFEEAVGELAGLGDLIKHHPGLSREARALRCIGKAEHVLNKLRVS